MNTNHPKSHAKEVLKQAQAAGHRLLDQEHIILGSRSGAMIGRYAQTVIKNRWPEAERLLLKHAGSKILVQYASKVIKGRWPEAEERIISESILDNATCALYYQSQCVKDRWPEAESRLLADADTRHLFEYANKYVADDWPDLGWKLLHETIWNDDWEPLRHYFQEVVGGRWRRGERAIARSSVAVPYARDILKSRWPLWEKQQQRVEWNHTVYADMEVEQLLQYAREVVGGRWDVAEHVILTHFPEYICNYAKEFIQGRWPEGEDVIAGTSFEERYAREVLPGHLDEEVADKCNCWRYFYAKDVIGGKLPPVLHNKMVSASIAGSDDPWIKKYFKAKKYQ